MAKFIYKSRVGVVLEAEDGEELTPDQAAAYARMEIADHLESLQLRIESLTDTYNHYQGLTLRGDDKVEAG